MEPRALLLLSSSTGVYLQVHVIIIIFLYSIFVWIVCQKDLSRAGKKAKWIAAKPDDPSSILRTHLVEGENRLLQVVYACAIARAPQ